MSRAGLAVAKMAMNRNRKAHLQLAAAALRRVPDDLRTIRKMHQPSRDSILRDLAEVRKHLQAVQAIDAGRAITDGADAPEKIGEQIVSKGGVSMALDVAGGLVTKIRGGW